MFVSGKEKPGKFSRRTILRLLLAALSITVSDPVFGQLDLGGLSGTAPNQNTKKKKPVKKSKKKGQQEVRKDKPEDPESEKTDPESERNSDEEKKPEEQNEETPAEKGPKFSRPTRTKYRIGLSLEARPNGECSEVFGSVPFPLDFPDQKVRIIEEECPEHVKMKYRDLKEGGCRQLLVKMKTLYAGEKADAVVTAEITRFDTAPPDDTENYTIPSPVPKEIKEYLRESPCIEIGSAKVKKAAKEAAADQKDGWQKAESILKYVRETVQYKEAYKEKPVRGALAAIETGEGDCEDMSTLFIALCRINGIPARTVRVPEHCWAEFYLQGEDGNGYWFPAQVAGHEPLGVLTDHRMILQKGDAYRVPESPKEISRYVKELFTGKVAAAGADPIHQFIREEIR